MINFLSKLFRSNWTSFEDLGMDEYEVALCEPLHDLKNLINVIFDEVYNQTKNKELRQLVMDFCPHYTVKTIYTLKCKSKVYQYRKLNKHVTRIVIFH